MQKPAFCIRYASTGRLVFPGITYQDHYTAIREAEQAATPGNPVEVFVRVQTVQAKDNPDAPEAVS